MISSSPVAGGEGERSVMVVPRYDPPARRDRDRRSKAASTAWISGAYPPRGEDHGAGEAPRAPRTPPGHGASTRSPATSGSRTCGRCRRRAARTTSPGWCERSRPADPAQSASRAARALFAIRWKARRAARLGRTGRRRRRPGRRRSATGCPPTCATAPAARTSTRSPFTSALPARRRVGGGDRQPDHARGDAHRLGPGRDRRLPRPDGRAGQAERPARRPPTWPRSGRSGT